MTGVFGEMNGTFGVFVQRYDGDGMQVSGPVTLNADPAGTQSYPAVGHSADGRAVIAWEDNADDGTPSRIVLKAINQSEMQPNQQAIVVSPQDVEGAFRSRTQSSRRCSRGYDASARQLGLVRVDAMGWSLRSQLPKSRSVSRCLASGAEDEAVMIYLAGSGANLGAKLARIHSDDGAGDVFELPTQRVAPYQPSLDSYRGRIAAAWTERADDMGFRIRLALMGVDSVQVND